MIPDPVRAASRAFNADDCEEAIQGIEHFIIGDNDELERIWRPLVVKLEALKLAVGAAAVPPPLDPRFGQGNNNGDLPCSRCGLPVVFEFCAGSVDWNRIVRPKNVGDYLCFWCFDELAAADGERGIRVAPTLSGRAVEVVYPSEREFPEGYLMHDRPDWEHPCSAECPVCHPKCSASQRDGAFASSRSPREGLAVAVTVDAEHQADSGQRGSVAAQGARQNHEPQPQGCGDADLRSVASPESQSDEARQKATGLIPKSTDANAPGVVRARPGRLEGVKLCQLCGGAQPCPEHGRTPVTQADFDELHEEVAGALAEYDAEVARPGRRPEEERKEQTDADGFSRHAEPDERGANVEVQGHESGRDGGAVSSSTGRSCAATGPHRSARDSDGQGLEPMDRRGEQGAASAAPVARAVPIPARPEAVTTYTPMLWVVLNEDERYAEYVRVREQLEATEAARIALHQQVDRALAERDASNAAYEREENLRYGSELTAAGANALLKKADAEVAALRQQVEQLQHDIDAFNRTDHDREGAAQVWHDLYREADADVAALRARVQALLDALTKIRDGHPSGDCACEHDDENCCAKVGEWCAVCLAAAALAEKGQK